MKCRAGEGWRRPVGLNAYEMKKDYVESRRRGISNTHLAEELSSQEHYGRKDRTRDRKDGKTREKDVSSHRWP